MRLLVRVQALGDQLRTTTYTRRAGKLVVVAHVVGPSALVEQAIPVVFAMARNEQVTP